MTVLAKIEKYKDLEPSLKALLAWSTICLSALPFVLSFFGYNFPITESSLSIFTLFEWGSVCIALGGSLLGCIYSRATRQPTVLWVSLALLFVACAGFLQLAHIHGEFQNQAFFLLIASSLSHVGFYVILCLGYMTKRFYPRILMSGIVVSLIPAILSVLDITVFSSDLFDSTFFQGYYLSNVSYFVFFLAIGFEFWNSLKKTTYEISTLNGALVTVQDTARLLEVSNEQLSSAVVQANQRARTACEASEYKTLFLAKMSHEIRTPLNTLVGFSQLLGNQLNKMDLPNNCMEYLKSIQVGSHFLSALINNILDLAKIEAGKTTISLENVDIQILFQNEYHLHKASADQKGIYFNYDWDQNLPFTIRTDAAKIHQIISNVVSNAIKNTANEGRIFMKAFLVGNSIQITIEDNGKGIPRNKIQQLFMPFQQIADTKGNTGLGTGLGLAITKQLVELLGGQISVESEESKGTTFIINLPFQAVEESSEGKKSIENVEMRFDSSNVVLIIEDDLGNQQMLSELLRGHGIQHIHQISSGEQALASILDKCPDVVLLDLNLQGVDGLAVVMAVRFIKDPQIANTNIVVITADAFTERHERASKLGIVDYLLKPVDTHDLIAVLSKYLKVEDQVFADTSIQRLPIPDEIRQEVIEVIQGLKQVPMHHGAKVLEVLDMLREKCVPYNHPFSYIFDGLERAVYSANDKQYTTLLEEGCRLGDE